MIRTDLVVVMCTYNGAEHVAEQISSICRQQVLPARIAIFDDGSTDGTTAEVYRAFDDRPDAALDVVLSVHTSTTEGRLGPTRNFQRAIASTDEPLVALADQDDVWLPGRLGRAVSALDDDRSMMLVASDARIVDGAGGTTGTTVWDVQHLSPRDRAAIGRGDVLPVLLKQNIAPGMTFTLRRSFADAHVPMPEGVMHDYWLLLAAATAGGAHVIADPLVDYRLHGKNAIGLGNRRHPWSRRIRTWREIARTPLKDYAQWTYVVHRLVAEDPRGHLTAARGKASFERRRRYPGMRRLRRLPSFIALLRSGDYARFEHTGFVGAVKDLVRPSATDLGSGEP